MSSLRPTAQQDPPPQEIMRLIGLLHHADPQVRHDAEILLRRILQNVHLDYSTHYVIATLEALALHTDPRPLRFVPREVEMLALSGKSYTGNVQVQIAARVCLEHWQSYYIQQEQADTLLRASERPVGADSLLRPAESSTETPPEQLLRAHTEADEM
jgi:hypothetical protein